MLVHTIVMASSPERQTTIVSAMAKLKDVVVRQVADGESLWAQLSSQPTDLVAVDLSAFEGSPETFIQAIRATPDAPEVVVFVGDGEDEQRAKLQAAQAFAVVDLGSEAAAEALQGVTARLAAQRQQQFLAGHLADDGGGVGDFASSSPSMQDLLNFLRRVVDTNSTLLVLGETGVGKEYLSRAIHKGSSRGGHPFVPVNCGALSATLLESELFGHVEGAFTGASRGRKGYFELAHHGTLFLDEIGELEPSVQVKLLRVLQDKRVQPVGGESEIEVDVRLIAATNLDLVKEVEAGRFRSDLFYRLSVVRLDVPPLRRRREDIKALFENNVEHFRAEMGRRVEGVREDAMQLLTDYQWPGNIRELANVAERAVLLSHGPLITPDDLPPEVRSGTVLRPGPRPEGPSPSPAPRQTPKDRRICDRHFKEARDEMLEQFERTYFEALMRECRGHITDASKRSGLHTRTIYDKLKQLGLKKETFKL